VERTGTSSLTLPAEQASVREARRFVAESIEEVVDDPADVLLMTSELVTNVVRHTETEVTVTVRPGPPVRVEVHDGIAATETFRQLVSTPGRMPEPSAPGGRGLALVRALAGRIGLDDDPDGGKVVWFEL
jgi:anti-sigma regulatory factor (Ser/Thr protein kinase)